MDLSREQGNDLYWVTERLSEMSRELATPDTDHDFTSDNFDALHRYLIKYQDDEGKVEGGLTFRMSDGRGISVDLCLLNVDNLENDDDDA